MNTSSSSLPVPAQVAHAHTLMRHLGEPPLGGNRLEVMASAAAARTAFLHALHEARDHVNLDAALLDIPGWRNDLVAVLSALCRHGVKVQVLAGPAAGDAGTLNELLEAGATVNAVTPSWRPGAWVERHFRSVRRQLAVVDGRVAWCGPGLRATGHNAAAPHICVSGPIVQRLQRLFLTSWKAAGPRAALARKDYFPPITLVGRQSVGMVMPAGSDAARPQLGCPLVGAVNTARFSVFIGMAQRVPPRPLMQAIASAAQRGVNVSVLLPHGTPRAWPWRQCCADLLRTGAWVYQGAETQPLPPHCIVDGVWSSVALDGGSGWHSGQLGGASRLIVLDAGFASELDDACQTAMASALLLDVQSWLRPGADHSGAGVPAVHPEHPV